MFYIIAGILVFVAVVLAGTYIFLRFQPFAQQLTSKSSKLGEIFSLEIGQEAFIENENLKLKFLDVINDSRCPVDAHCVWAGEAVALVNIWKNGKNIVDFEIGKTGKSQLYFNGYPSISEYSLFLKGISPSNCVDKKIKKSEYTFNFVFYKNIE